MFSNSPPCSVGEAGRPINFSIGLRLPRDVPGCPACESAALGCSAYVASNTAAPPTSGRWLLSPPPCRDGTLIADSPAVILRHSAPRSGRLHQQKARHRVALLTDGSQSLPTSAATLSRIQPEVAHHLFATPEPLHRPDRQHEHQGRDRPHAGLLHQAAGGRALFCFFGYRSIQLRRSSMSSSSCRRRLAHGSNRKASSSVRPPAAHNFLLRYTPWPLASACNWFLTEVRRQTILWRCRNSCRRSRSSGEGIQICGNRFCNIK